MALSPTFNVAVIGTGGARDDSGFAATRDQLNNDSFFDFNATHVNPTDVDTVEELNACDAVVIGNQGNAGGDRFEVFAPALRSWVEAGGGVVATGFTVGCGIFNWFSGHRYRRDCSRHRRKLLPVWWGAC